MDTNNDVVSNPSHYTLGKIQPIEYIMANSMEFWRGNIIKYATRAGYKGYQNMTKQEAEILDLKKVIQYAQFRIDDLTNINKVHP